MFTGRFEGFETALAPFFFLDDGSAAPSAAAGVAVVFSGTSSNYAISV